MLRKKGKFSMNNFDFFNRLIATHPIPVLKCAPSQNSVE
jgi:hypothetical protein